MNFLRKCCKKTVNSTAERGAGYASVCLETAATFSDLFVESDSVETAPGDEEMEERGGGWGERR